MGLAYLEMERGQWSWSTVERARARYKFEDRQGSAGEVLEVRFDLIEMKFIFIFIIFIILAKL